MARRARQAARIGIAGAAALALSACGGGTAATTGADFGADVSGEITVWGFENADEVGQSRVDLADAALGEQGATVTMDAAAFDAQRFTTLAASGQLPDVVQMDRQFVATYAAQGLVMPLDECFAAHEVDPASYWYPQVVDDVRFDGGVYGVPQFYQPPLILMNARVMEAAGVSPEQLDTSDPDAVIAAAEAMTVMEGGTPTRIGFDPQGVSKAGLWMLAFGGQIIDADGRPTLDAEGNVAAIEFLQRLYDAQGGYAEVKSFVDSFDVFGDQNPYVADQVGAAVFDQWYVNVLTPYADDVQLAAAPVRTPEGEPFTVASGTSFVIPVTSDNPAAACTWLIELTSPAAWDAAGEARAQTTADDPERHGINAGLFTGSPEADAAVREAHVGTTGYPGFDEAIAAYYEVAASGESFGSSPAGQQIQSELQNAMTRALLGEASAADALAEAQAAAQRAYDQVAGQ